MFHGIPVQASTMKYLAWDSWVFVKTLFREYVLHCVCLQKVPCRHDCLICVVPHAMLPFLVWLCKHTNDAQSIVPLCSWKDQDHEQFVSESILYIMYILYHLLKSYKVAMFILNELIFDFLHNENWQLKKNDNYLVCFLWIFNMTLYPSKIGKFTKLWRWDFVLM